MSDFKIQSPLKWLDANREEVLLKAYTCLIYWLQQGRPRGRRVLGSFKEWSEVLGGIAQVCGLPGFLDNLDDESESVDLKTLQLRELFTVWATQKGTSEWLPAQALVGLCLANDLFLEQLADKTPGGQARSLGKILANERDNSYGGLLLTRKPHKGQWKYLLTRVGSEVPQPPSDPEGPSGGPSGGGGADPLADLFESPVSTTVQTQTNPKPTTKPTPQKADNHAVEPGEGGFGGFGSGPSRIHVPTPAREAFKKEPSKPTNPPQSDFGSGPDLEPLEWERVEKACHVRRTKLRSGFGKPKGWPADVLPLLESGRWVPPHDLGGPAPRPVAPPETDDQVADALWDAL